REGLVESCRVEFVTSPYPTIRAADHIDVSLPIPENAERLAALVASLLDDSGSVLVDLSGVRGISSPFCNQLLAVLSARRPKTEILSQVHFRFDTPTQ